MKKLIDLTEAEINALYDNNEAFKSAVYDRAVAGAEMWRNEFLYSYKWDYSISHYYDYIKVPMFADSMDDFEEWLDEVQSDGLFSAETEIIIRDYIAYIRDLDDASEEGYEDVLWKDVKERNYSVAEAMLRGFYADEDRYTTDEYLRWEAGELVDILAHDYKDCFVDDDWHICTVVPEHVKTIM